MIVSSLTRFACLALVFTLVHVVTPAHADTGGGVDARHYQSLSYRLVGPFRAGRTVGAVGVTT
ncbi:MAG: hypothetical protein AAFY56_24265 [Pseudomonadota bacterium]